MNLHAAGPPFTFEPRTVGEFVFRIEEGAGYAASGQIVGPGYFRVDLIATRDAIFVASTESWEAVVAIEPDEQWNAEESGDGRAGEHGWPGCTVGSWASSSCWRRINS